MKIEDEGRLASLPVRNIPVELLAEYNDSAKPEKTRIEELKHFLPRYLELTAEFKFPSHSAELSFSRFTPFTREEWTEPELELLEIFAEEFFLHCLKTHPLPSFNDNIDGMLIMFWKAGFVNIDKLLKIWEQHEDLSGLLHFNELVLYGFESYNRTKLLNAFADTELSKKLLTWTQNTRTKSIFEGRIERAMMGESTVEEQTLNELNLLYEMVRFANK